MKFGRALISNQDPDIKDHYIDYERLKKLLIPFKKKPFQSHRKSLSIDLVSEEKLFLNVFKEEVDKVEGFYLKKVGDMRVEVQELVQNLYDKKHIRHSQNNIVSLSNTDVNNALSNITESLTILSENYIPLNKTAITKILKKHDKFIGDGITPEMAALRKEAEIHVHQGVFWSKGEKMVAGIWDDVRNVEWELPKEEGH